MSERDEARRATIATYANRFGTVRFKPNYTGEFPFREVANRTPITDYPDLTDHQICWNRLYSNFDLAWDAFHMEQP